MLYNQEAQEAPPAASEAQGVRHPQTQKRTLAEITSETEGQCRVTHACVAEQQVVLKLRALKRGTGNKGGTGRRK